MTYQKKKNYKMTKIDFVQRLVEWNVQTFPSLLILFSF